MRFRLGFDDVMGCRGGVEYSLVDGLARLRVIVVEDDVSICWVDGGDVLLLDNIFWFVVEWDVADTLVDMMGRVAGGK